MSKIRFGIMCSGSKLAKWQAETVNRLLKLQDVELALLICEGEQYRKNKQGKSRIKKLFARRSHILWYAYRKLFAQPSAQDPIDMSEAFARTPQIECSPQLKGRFSEYFSEADNEKILSYDLDFILRFGYNIIRGDIHNTAKWGIWSFHHDDEQQYRGRPACFWEIYHDADVTGSILQRLTDKLDAGVVLKKGYFGTRKLSYKENFHAALMESANWPAQVCRQILLGDTSVVDADPSQTKAPIYKKPTNWEMIIYLFKLFRNYISRIYNVVLRYQDKWAIGWANNDLDKVINSSKLDISWLPESKKRTFQADPFGYIHNENLHILHEAFSYKTKRGTIDELSIDESGNTSHHRDVLGLTYHASYPYIFRHKDNLYCTPETYESEGVFLFCKSTESGEWEYKMTLLDGIRALDPTVITYNGLWWLLYTVNGELHHNAKLYIQFAHHLEGPWTPHPLNPVKTDIHSSRPAGHVFQYNGILFRPAQCCTGRYGSKIAINKIKKLTPEYFEEEVVNYLHPVEPYSGGTHTLSFAGNYLLVDGVYSVLNFQAAIPRIVELVKQKL